MKPKTNLKQKKQKRSKQRNRNYYSVKWEPQSFKVRVFTWLGSIWTAIRYFPGKIQPTVVPNKVASELSWLAHTEPAKRPRKQVTNYTYSKWD